MLTRPDDPLLRFTDPSWSRPLPGELLAARRDVMAAARDLRAIPDSALGKRWAWKADGEEQLRYGFYRIAETFERAAILARAAVADCVDPGRAADIIAPATAARWDLEGLLFGVPEHLWDADPGAGEWSIRRTMGHIIATQRAYAINTAWWQRQAFRIDDPNMPAEPPEEIEAGRPSEETEGQGVPAEVSGRLSAVLGASATRLAGLPADRLSRGARWSGFAVDIAFRLGRWSSHIREHTIQIEKTLAALGYRPAEVERLVRLVLASWGRAEEVVYGSSGACESVRQLTDAAAEGRAVASEMAGAVAR